MVIGLATLVTPAHALEPDEATDYLQNPARTGSLAGDWLEPPLVHRWTSEELGSPISFPLIAGDRVFVTARTGDAYGDVTLYALDRATGDLLWSHRLGGTYWIGDPAYGDGRVFVVNGDGLISAFSADSGDMLWSRSVLPSHYSSRVPPTVVGRRLLVGLGDILVALDVETGDTLWTGVTTGAGGTPAAVDSGRAYGADGCGNVTARELANGALAWQRRSGHSCGAGTHVAVHRGRVYVQDREGDGGLALDAGTGAPVEGTPFNGGLAYWSLTLVGDVGVFLSGTTNRHVEARDLAAGNVVWEQTLPPDEGIEFPPVAVGDDTYLAREPGALSSHDLASGASTWSVALGAELTACCDNGPTEGFAAGQGILVAPSGNRLEAYGGAGPDTWIEDAPSEVSTERAATFTFDSTEVGARFECSFDEQPWAPCVSPASRTQLEEGEHSFRVRASTIAAEVDPHPSQRIWRVDVTPPETTLASGPPERTTTSQAEFVFGSPDPDDEFECRLDGSDWSPCVSPRSYAVSDDGVHEFAVRAVDTAGLHDPTPEVWSWEIDGTPPETSVTAAPAAVTRATEARFEFASSSSDASGFECRLDGAEWSGCTSPTTYTGLGDGSHVFEVRALDAAGNRDPIAARSDWRIDTVAPRTQITSGPSGTTTDRSASFSFAASPTGSAASFECRLDGGAWEGCTSPRSYSGLQDGRHVFEVRALDSLGNADPSPARRSWTIGAPRAPRPPRAPTTPPATPGAPGIEAVQLFADLTPGAVRILRRGAKATVVLPSAGWSLTAELRTPGAGSTPGRVISRLRRTNAPTGRIRLRLRPRRSARALVRPGARLLLEVRVRPPFGQAIPLRRALTLGR